jgi:hypothetical protein
MTAKESVMMKIQRASRFFTFLGTGLVAVTLLATLVSAATQIDIVGPAGSGYFGVVTVLPNGNLVVCDPNYDAGSQVNVGAVYLYNGATGALVSTLTGSTANDRIGSQGVITLANGNFVVISPDWDNGDASDAGAVTWASGTTGVIGAVSPANSLVGGTAGDRIGSHGVTALANGNYVVQSPFWRNGDMIYAGAATWGSGDTGISGAVSPDNSLVGGMQYDNIGNQGVTALANGNYVVISPYWDNGAVGAAGAVTWGSGDTGISGAVSPANSLVGSKFTDNIGWQGVTALANGNYVVRSYWWDNGAVSDAGAVTWGSGTAGVSGAVSPDNSLVGSTNGDFTGNIVTALPNGNYVVISPEWDNGAVINAGAVTWGSGTAGVSGAVSASNSLVGSTAGDYVGNNLKSLANGNYVVISPEWDNGDAADAGAVTWGSGTAGVSGAVGPINSLVGSTAGDYIGYNLTAMANGNYLVISHDWDNGDAADAGAVTWGSGTAGISGAVSPANSLVGSTAGDRIGSIGVTVLANGNFVVISSEWDNGAVINAGAVTWGSGTAGISGAVSPANSLVGSTAGDWIGSIGVTNLANGNFVVISSEWDNGAVINAGAVTWGSGDTGISGAVSPANSLVGSTAYDYIGWQGVTALTNGNYVVSSALWDNGAARDAGAATWGSGTAGINGAVSPANSLVGGTAGDWIGGHGAIALANGNYVVRSPLWDNGAAAEAGAATWGSGDTGICGAVSPANSLVGSTASDYIGNNVTALANDNYVVRSPLWDNGAASDVGAVTWGRGTAGVSGAVSPANSLVGSTAGDNVGWPGVTALGNGNYVVVSSSWDNGATSDAGAVTWGSGLNGTNGPVSTDNSVCGQTPSGGSNLNWAFDGSNYQLVVGRPSDNIVTLFRPNLAPVANAGPDELVNPKALVTLDGSGSSDPDGNGPLAYQWAQSGGSQVTLSGETNANPTFTAPDTFTETITLTFTLVVSDSFGMASQPAQVIITVVPHPLFLPMTAK